MILLSHLPGEKPFSSGCFDLTHVECVDDLDYSRAVQAGWDSTEPLVVIEHDMEVSDDLIGRLLDEPVPLATYAYTLHWVSTHRAAAFAQRTGSFPAGRRYLGQPIRDGAGFCDFSGLGFCKIDPTARVRPLEESSWQTVDMAVDAAIDARWTVLWPEIEHHHV